MPIQEKLSGIKDRAKEYSVRVAAGTAIAMGIVGLAGCSNAELPQPEPTSISTEAPSVEPSTDPALTEDEQREQEYIERNIIERDSIPADLEQYRDMSVEDFQALPFAERQAYASWLTSYREEYATVRAPYTEIDPPTTLTADSTPEEMLYDYLTTVGMAAYQTEGAPTPDTWDGTCGPLNTSDTAKLISATWVDNQSELGVENRNQTIDMISNLENNKAICPSSQDDYPHLDLDSYTIMQTAPPPNGTDFEIDGQSVGGARVTYEIEGLPNGERDHTTLSLGLFPVQNPDGSDGFRAVVVTSGY